ncbi:MAG: right-handed parallel beta-helix repeat-containing protein, partial [Salinivirgaceae bacterium]
MKSTILIIAILAQVLLGKVILNAQTSDSVYKARINYIFAQVNHSKVTTGLLFDYGLHLIPPQYYNGVLQDSNEVDIEIWKTLYSGIYGCKFNNLGTALATPQAVYGLISQNTPTADVTIPIAAMAIEYEKLRDDAITASLVKVVNDQIVEISTVSPYEKKILFAACPVKTELEASTVTFTFGSTLLKTNYPYTVTTIKADMGDGSGLQTVVNGSKTVTYPVSGIKHFTIQYTFSNGKVLNTHGNFMVDFESTLKASTIYSVSFQKTVDIPANSKHSGGTLFIRYGAKHEIAQKLRKPFIVVEGYDPFWAIGYGSLTIKQFLYDDSENKSLYSIFTKTTGGTLASELYNNDYDIIYLDYNRGTDDIRRNAALLEDALDKINNELKEPYSDANVVMGISMGGLVARYALRKMELAGKNHDSQLFFTMDTPHKGANVPLGYQKVISSLYNSIIDLNVPMLDKAIKLMNEPATKQLLIYQDNSSTDHNVFFNELETMGLPQNTTNIALSNGSGYGSLTFAPNTELFKFTYDYKFNFLEGTAYAYLSLILGVKSIANLVPGRTDLYAEITINALNTNANRVYQNHIWITKKILWFIPITNDLYYREAYAPAGCLPLDGAPGGKYSTSVFLSGDIPDEFKSAIKEEAFCFIPTTSALGLKDWGTYLTSDLSPYNLITNGQCPFDEYFTGMPTTNQVHTDFRTPPTLGNYIASSIKSKTVPSIPQSLEGSASTNNIVLTWDDASYNETGFEIQRSLDPVTGFTTVANIGTDIETYTDNGANNSKVYYYRIRSSNSFGNSEWVYNSNMSCSGAYKITTTQSFSNTIFFPCGFEVTSGAVLSITSSVIVPNDKDILVSSGATLVLQNGASIINTEGGVWTGNFIVNTNGELNINTGYSYIKTAGNIDFSNSGKLTVNGALTISGALLINGTNGIFTLNGVLNITNTTLFNLSNIAAFNGTINAGNSVNLVIESGKTIDLTSGKAINISNSGILTINGSLTMNGGTFSKNGTSKLYLNGALNFSPFYTFTIDCYTELNGTINVPANFSLTFSGSNKSTVLLNVKKSFVFDADLATLTIQNGKIIMDNSTSELYFNNGIDNINLNNIWVTSSTGANNGHQGIDIRSDGNISVTNSKFEQGYYGVYASRAATAPNLNITISTFKNNAYGLRVYNSGVTIDGSTFESNTAMGIYSTSMDKSSSITNSTIRYQNGTGDYGVYYEGVSTAGLTFVSNGINSNYNGVSLVGGFNAVFKCNTISANSNSGVSAQNNGAIFLANAAGITGGNNDMHSNKIALSGSGTTQYFNSFYLNNGYNDLRDNGV